jgi:hypothetical protein
VEVVEEVVDEVLGVGVALSRSGEVAVEGEVDCSVGEGQVDPVAVSGGGSPNVGSVGCAIQRLVRRV